MNILLIGGTGFIGTYLTKALCQEHDVHIVDVRPFTKEKLTFLSDNDWTFSNVSLREMLAAPTVLRNANVIVPLTGLLGSVPSIKNPMRSLHSSVDDNLALLCLLAELGLKPLVIFPSTDLVHRPRCIYSLHKALVEGYLEVFNRTHDIPYINFRVATVYGPFQERASVVNFFVQRALDGKSIPVYGKGDNKRAFIYVEDVATGFRDAIEGRFPRNRTYNLVGHNDTLVEVANAVIELVGGTVEHIPWPEVAKAVDAGHLLISNDLAPWGWEPIVGLREGILKTKEWLDGTI